MWPFGKPSPAKFARTAARGLKRRGCSESLTYDKEDFALRSSGPTYFLGNAYAEYCSAPFLRKRVALASFLDSFMEMADELPSSLDEARSHLLPKIRDRFSFESLRLRSGLRDQSFPEIQHRALAEHLALDVVYDAPKSVRTISPEELALWGIEFDEALAIARDNLWRISNEPFAKLGPRTYVSTWHDTHDATRLFLHDLVWQLEVKGSHVAMVPDRNVLLVTGSEDDEGLERITAEARHILGSSPRAMSGLAFVLVGSSWEPFVPAGKASACAGLRLLAIEHMGGLYGEQKELLDALNERSGTDLFVATYGAMRKNQTEEAYSWCTWTRGADSLLPKTDWIALADTSLPEGKELLGFVEWEKLAPVVGTMLDPVPAMYPARYRAREFPSEEQLRQAALFDP